MQTIRIILTLLIFFLSGCTISKSGSVATSTSNPAALSSATNGSLFAVDEVGLGTNGYVALTNFTDQPASLAGLVLCQSTKCFELPNVDVAPGTIVRLAVEEGEGIENVVATRATIGELHPSDGEVALYLSKNTNDPKAILAYLEWGSTPHGNTQTAIDAGLWIKGSFAPSSDNATRLYRTEGGLWLFDEK